MKSKLILSLSLLGLSVDMLGVGFPASAHSVEKEHTLETTQSQLLENDILPIFQESHKEKVVNPNARTGYRWRCKTCGYTSEWHAFNNTASKYAVAHHMKYGHSVVVYGV